jgi:hypothetical protein
MLMLAPVTSARRPAIENHFDMRPPDRVRRGSSGVDQIPDNSRRLPPALPSAMSTIADIVACSARASDRTVRTFVRVAGS